MAEFLLDNDHSIALLALQNSEDKAWVEDATVGVTVYERDKTTEVAGLVFPISMAYVNPGTDTIGGEASDPTVVKSCSGWNMTVTVGGTNALDMPVGTFVRALHSPRIWRVILSAAGAAASDVVLHLEPIVWPVADDEEEDDVRPTSVSETVGEIVEFVGGIYRAILDKDVELSDRATYYAKVDVTEPGGLDGSWMLKGKAAYRY